MSEIIRIGAVGINLEDGTPHPERPIRSVEGRRLAEDPITLAELAGEFGVSRERVRQIEVRALEKVQKAVKNRVAAIETPVHQPMH